MSGLAHYFEDEGLATVIVALVREHVLKMRPPRALWVPFELGRPFGTPNDAGLQRRVLKSALALFDKPVTAPLLEDFDEEASGQEGDVDWCFPGKLDTKCVVAEAASVLPIWRDAQKRFGRTSVGISGLSPESAVEYIERYHAENPMPNPKGMAKVSRARFAIDDIKAFYFEAATASGYPSSLQLHNWFWNHTIAGSMIRDFQDRARHSDDKNLLLIAGSLVPAERTYQYS